MKKKELWVDKYRPKNLDEYVCNDDQFEQIKMWISEKHIPNMILTGHPGVGKTALAMMLMHIFNVDDSDIKFVNGSITNGIDFVRELENFVSIMPFGEFRYVIIDEADGITHAGQSGLRNMIETYSSVARFIFTANYSQKIIPALKSRCQTFEIQRLDKAKFIERIATILLNEGIELDSSNLNILDEYVTVTYPDLRKCITMLQQNCTNNTLCRPIKSSISNTSELIIQAVSLFKKGRISDARKLLAPKLQLSDYDELYRILYQNLDWWGNTDKQQNNAIIKIANRLKDHAICADPEINFSALMVELEMIRNE